MIKSLPKTSHQLALCEANFLRLKKILNNFSVNKYLFETINPDSSSNSISFCVIHKTRHTLIIEAKQKIKLKKIENLIIRIQISLDAKLAEVISFQGERAVPYFMKVLKTQSRDEKIQQNRFLTEWLENIFANGINPQFKI
jgi:uncharacterized protein YqiB (DUF1249 family)|tara:strand:+ start:253 stop:675 length:423 start_codon:yes stop_codon:yes gene_type:complete